MLVKKGKRKKIQTNHVNSLWKLRLLPANRRCGWGAEGGTAGLKLWAWRWLLHTHIIYMYVDVQYIFDVGKRAPRH